MFEANDQSCRPPGQSRLARERRLLPSPCPVCAGSTVELLDPDVVEDEQAGEGTPVQLGEPQGRVRDHVRGEPRSHVVVGVDRRRDLAGGRDAGAQPEISRCRGVRRGRAAERMPYGTQLFLRGFSFGSRTLSPGPERLKK